MYLTVLVGTLPHVRHLGGVLPFLAFRFTAHHGNAGACASSTYQFRARAGLDPLYSLPRRRRRADQIAAVRQVTIYLRHYRATSRGRL